MLRMRMISCSRAAWVLESRGYRRVFKGVVGSPSPCRGSRYPLSTRAAASLPPTYPPIATVLKQAFIGCALALGGDVCAQSVEQGFRTNKWDRWRTLALSTFGAFWTGPFNAFWLTTLHGPIAARLVSLGASGPGTLAALKVVVQSCVNVTVYVPTFLVWQAVVRDRDVVKEVGERYGKT